MLSKFKKLFEKQEKATPESAQQRTVTAACALLIEMATTDMVFSAEEKNEILSILQNEYGLAGNDASNIMTEARQSLANSTDLWQFTSLINENFSKNEKLAVMELVWRVVFADGILDKHEEYMARKIADLLHLKHRELIDTKLKAIAKKN